MPWKGKQAQAIFLQKKREGGEKHAREFMHRHGNRSGKRRSQQQRGDREQLMEAFRRHAKRRKGRGR